MLRGAWSDTAVLRATIGAIAILGVASLALIYGRGLPLGDPIRSDAIGYYMYLPAVALDHDVTMERTVDRSFDGGGEGLPGLNRVPPHGHYLDQYPIGEAMLLAPFFGLGHVVALLAGTSTDGFSWPYQAAAAAAGFVYALIGLALVASTLRRWFRRTTVVVTLLAITFGTDLFHYATFDSTFSHAFAFALVALVVRLTLAVWERPRATTAAGLGASLALVALVRQTNAVVVVFCLLIGVESMRDVTGRLRALRRHFRLVVCGGVACLLVLIPQVAYWETITGQLYAYGYRGDHVDLLHPHFVGVLFSVRKGLFFWTPLVALAVIGLPLLRRFAPALFVPSIAYLAVQTWVVSSWTSWWYGGSFGMRPFVEAMPVFALGLAALIEGARSIVARRVVLAAIAVTTVIAVQAMFGYWAGRIPTDHATLHDYQLSIRYLISLRHSVF